MNFKILFVTKVLNAEEIFTVLQQNVIKLQLKNLKKDLIQVNFIGHSTALKCGSTLKSMLAEKCLKHNLMWNNKRNLGFYFNK